MSSSDTDVSDISNPATVSPPTSPIRDGSPPTSPGRNCTQESSPGSPATSPLKRKRRPQGKIHRTTVARRNYLCDQLESYESDGSGMEEDCVATTSNRPVAEEDTFDVGSPPPPSQTSDGSSATGSDSDESTSSSEGLNSTDVSDNGSSTVVENSSEENLSSDSDEGAQILCEGSAKTLNEALLDVLKLYVGQNWTKTGLDRCVKVIKGLLPEPNDFPSSIKGLLKIVEGLTGSYKEEIYFFCEKCSKLLSDQRDKCQECDDSGVSKFYSLPIRDQIKHFFEQRNLAEIIDHHSEHHGRREGYICDIQDGSEYKRIKEQMPGLYDLILVWCTDGVALSGSSNVELWPVPAIICEVPVRLRPSFMLICGIYVGPKKPNMNEFLKPFVKHIQELYTDGVAWEHPVTKQLCISKVTAPALSADAPAKAEVLCHGYFNSKYGCNTCEQKTKRIELTAEEILENEAQVNPRKRKKRKRRFLFQDDTRPANLRSGERMQMQGMAAELRGEAQKGVNGKAIVAEIPFLDRAHCVCAEYLHLVALGVVRYFLLKIFFENGDWYLGNNINDIDKFISNIKVPDFVKRRPRGITYMKYWKGSEFRNFLLYYSLPIFKRFLPDKFYQHWMLLTGAIYILLQEQISETDLDRAEIMLRCFVRDVGNLYGDACYTYNVHTLLHLCLLVRRWGNLFCTSGFIFENFNGFLSKHVHGTKHFGKELVENLKIYHSVSILQNLVNAGPRAFPRTPTPACTALLGRAWNRTVLSEAESSAIDELLPGQETYMVYYRAKIMSIIYTSTVYDKVKKRCNSYVQFSLMGQPQSTGFGQITAFIKCSDNSVLCCVQEFKVVNVNLFVHDDSRFVFKNLVPFEEKNTVIVVPVKDLITKLLKVGSYLAVQPNSYEVNL